MNRILFLPLNRHFFYFARRALLMGHIPFFKRRSIEAHLGHDSKWFIPGFFKDDFWRDCRDYYSYGSFWDQWMDSWRKYFTKFKITHVITDVEASVPVIAAMDVAKERGITRCYAQHGAGDIYDIPSNLGWYNSGVYDFYYATSFFQKSWVECFDGSVSVRAFRKPIKQSSNPNNKTILYAPLFNWPCDPDDPTKLGLTGLLLENEKRRLNNGFIVDFLHKNGWKILYCHDPRLDTEVYMPCYNMLEILHIDGKIEWIKDRAIKYLDKCSMAMTDIGSGFFFESINRGKPTICIHNIASSALKRGTIELFGDSLLWFNDRYQLEDWLMDFIMTKDFDRYIPRAYLDREKAVKNDSLVWEE